MSDVKDRMMAEERVQIAYNEAWQLAFDLADEHESAFRAGWNAALTDAQIVAAKDEEIRRLREALERIRSDFETDFVLDGVVVDEPATTHEMAWNVARAALNPPQQKEGQ